MPEKLPLEKLSVAETLRTIRRAEVAILVIDSQAIFEQQDLAIARLVAEEGRALVIAINKWDLVEDRTKAAREVRDALEASLPQVRGVAWIALSALTGDGVEELMPAVITAYEIWNRRIPTRVLNRWLDDVSARHPPPSPHGKPIQIRYVTQIKTRPPTFALFVNKPELLPETYTRYLGNSLRQAFGLAGAPLRFVARRGKNPFAPRKPARGKTGKVRRQSGPARGARKSAGHRGRK